MPPKVEIDGFKCPHRRQCWQREALRVVVSAMIASGVLYLGGCAMKWDGLGVKWQINPPATAPHEVG